MIHTSVSHEILKYLTGKVEKVSLTNAGTGCWIGFSTDAPTITGEGFNEPDPEQYPSYARVRLNLWDPKVTSVVDLWGTVGQDVDGNSKPGCVTNVVEFTTPECKEEGGWPILKYFGLFTSADVGTGKPLASDRLTDPDGEYNEETQSYPEKDLKVEKGHVAVFRKGSLELRFT